MYNARMLPSDAGQVTGKVSQRRDRVVRCCDHNRVKCSQTIVSSSFGTYFDNMTDRLETLRSMLGEQPDEPFLRFAMAQELCNAGQLELGIAHFESLRKDRPDYVGLYHHLSLALLQLDRTDEADAVLAVGIDQAEAAGDRHAADAMRTIRYNAALE